MNQEAGIMILASLGYCIFNTPLFAAGAVNISLSSTVTEIGIWIAVVPRVSTLKICGFSGNPSDATPAVRQEKEKLFLDFPAKKNGSARRSTKASLAAESDDTAKRGSIPPKGEEIGK